MKYLKSVVVFIPLFFTVLLTHAQAPKDTITSKQNDSLNTVVLNNYKAKLAEIEQQRLQDSAKKAALEVELNSLKTTDNLKKEELQKELLNIQGRDNERLAQKRVQIDSLRHITKGYPVMGFFNDTLFYIYSKLGSFTSKDRAEAITNKVHDLADNFLFKTDSLKIVPAETTVDIAFGTIIITSISENDALWNNSTKEALAQKYKIIIGDAVMHYKSETSFSTLIKEIGLALLVILIITLLIIYLGKFFKWSAKKIEQQEGKRLKGITIKNYTLFDAKREVNALLTANTVIKWFFIILVIYLTLPILFGIFPWTKNFAETLFGYILDPIKGIALSLWNYLPKLITIIVIVFFFRYVFRGLHFLKLEIERGALHIPGFFPDWANPTYQIMRVLVFAFMVIVIWPYLPGSNSAVFQGVSVFLGFLFTFGSAGSLSNLVAGFILTYMRLFKIGDRVKIGDQTGDVIEKSLLVTRIRTIKNEIISIPNSNVMNGHTINYSSDAPDKGLIVHTTVTIGYDVPWKNMHQALIDAALKTEHVLDNPKPFVLQTSLEDYYVAYQINAYTKEANKQALIYSSLHENIQDVCNERGIEIMSPHYRANRDGNATTIPADYLPKDYKAPGFNIHVDKDESDNTKL